jgi:uncharacterized phage protein gp47/JayE
LADLPSFRVRGLTEIKNGYLRTLRMGLIERGVANPNVGPKSDFAAEAEALGEQLLYCEANSVSQAQQTLEDTSTGEKLLRQAALRGVTQRAASGSRGPVVHSSSAPSPIVTGARLLDGAGLQYKVSVGATYASGATIAIEAVDTGDATNLDAGEVLRWVSPPPYAETKVLVGTGGLINGAPADDEETVRRRLLAVLANPANSGNASHVALVAENASSSVAKAFVYPGIQGAGSFHVCVIGSPTATNKTRVVDSATITGTIHPQVAAMVEHVMVTTTAATDVQATVAVGLSLPDAPSASPPGPGGGWTVGTPWPAPTATDTTITAHWRTAVTVLTSTTRFTCDAPTAPTASVSRICWLSPTDWKLHSALVTAVHATTPGAVEVTIDTPFPSLAVGCLIWPECEQAQDLCDAALAHFKYMGPGEKTANAGLLTRSHRHPTPMQVYPYALDATYLDTLRDVVTDLRAAQFYFRDYTALATPVRGSTAGSLKPAVPAATTDPPNIFIPQHIAFYRVAS